MTDLLLACAHHALAFLLLALLVAECALLARRVDAQRLRTLAALDAAYGACAALVIAAGFGRVFFGAKGAPFYLHNPVFWAKLACLLAVGLLSVVPTLKILRWRRAVRTHAGFEPAPGAILALRRWLFAELALFAPIPLLAAAMARGVGLA